MTMELTPVQSCMDCGEEFCVCDGDVCPDCERSECACSDDYAASGLFEDDFEDDFADPGGVSALRAASPSNPRNLPCPSCGRANMLTPKDRRLGYQCDRCANQAECGW